MENDKVRFTYDEREICLLNLLPEIYKPIYDFRAIANGSCEEVEPLYNGVKAILDNTFINTASDSILAKWEKHLGITPNATDTLDERRFRILAKLNDSPPYTDAYLEKRLDELCGKDCWRVLKDYDQYQLVVQISASSATNNATVADVVRKIIPANMTLVVQDFRTRHSELTGYTHEQLAAYTHDDIKYRRIGN